MVNDCGLILSRGVFEAVTGANPRGQLLLSVLSHSGGAEACAVTLHSVVNAWGFVVARDGSIIRLKAGASDEGTFLDEGAPLPEEVELLAQSTIDAHGARAYRLAEFPGEIFTEDQVGEDYVFRILERFTDESWTTSSKLMATECVGFRYAAFPQVSRPWWKIWK